MSRGADAARRIGGAPSNARPLEVPITPRELAFTIAELARSRKAEDITLLDMSAVVSFCDHFVLCNGSNPRQVRAIANHVQRSLKGVPGLRLLGAEGHESARWVLVDYGEVVLHVFDRELRGFYDLDGLWADAPAMEVPEGFELPPEVKPREAKAEPKVTEPLA